MTSLQEIGLAQVIDNNEFWTRVGSPSQLQSWLHKDIERQSPLLVHRVIKALGPNEVHAFYVKQRSARISVPDLRRALEDVGALVGDPDDIKRCGNGHDIGYSNEYEVFLTRYTAEKLQQNPNILLLADYPRS